jgi:hypothetical protein
VLSAGNELPATRHKASCGQDAGLTGADLVEQNCATRLGVFENSRPTFDAHHLSLAGLALVVGDIAFTEPLELNGRQHFGLMLGIELGKLRKRAQPTPSQILVAHLSIVAALQRPCSGRPASPFASCYRANLNPPSWSRQLNEQSALMRALAARPIGPDSVAHG